MIHDDLTSSTEPPESSNLSPPPSYRASLAVAPPTNTRRSSLHPHQSRAPVEHIYQLFDSRNAPWASLKLLSNVGSPRFLPAYFEGQTIHGSLALDLRKPETILGINVTISGTIVAANAPEPRIFWELARELWNADMGDPRAPNEGPSSSTSTAPSQSKFKNVPKLVGAYSWSFAMQLPSTCTVSFRSKQPPVTLPLPPSFSEKGASQFINYEITVRIRRGPLRVDSKLGTHFGFTPRSRPPSQPSLLRQLAYQEDNPISGPEDDPEGWTILPPIVVRGKVFGVRMVEAVCTFALALPLTYTRGAPIPMMLTVSCADTQALDLVFTPQNTSVHLIREVCYDNSSSESIRNDSTRGWGDGLESSPSDRSLGVMAPALSTFGFPRAFLPRATASSASSPTSSQVALPSMSSTSFASSSTRSSSTSPFSAFSRTPKSEKKTKPPKVAPKLALNGARAPITSGVWWSSGNTSPSSSAAASRFRRMEGEILLPKDLVPTFVFGGFSVKYALALLAFQVPGFELIPATSQPQIASTDADSPRVLTSDPLLLTHIDIATLPASPSASTSSTPRSRVPPGLDAQTQRAAHAERLRRPVVWGLFNHNGNSK